MRLLILSGFLLVFVSSPIWSYAEAAEAFSFVCDDERTVGFRDVIAIDGSKISAGWHDDSFGDEWKFDYSGSGDKVKIDGKPFSASFTDDTAVVIEYYNTGVAQSVWVYAINLRTSMVVGAQVNAYNLLGAGVKTRSVEFSCDRLK